ncbi:ATP-binding protein [Jiangella mangrovi]|uniref:Putative AAA+ superfamily ATPase n=1 Tax=Jiangella mangrovi TaxID=1524084 RepID=A0A7W9LP16_9ACTN|nr:ATP-binding protein [Jiangella mangrovi]MBB5790841.1 putative AAA+ superfamily ATPase [Jiangella mangrovi]
MDTTDERPGLISRRVFGIALESMTAFRVVVLHGARQVGKTTLAQLLAAHIDAGYVTLDRNEDREVAVADPQTFIESLGTPQVIDEVQRVGEPLVLAIKQVVDADRRPGQYLLTGSTNFLTVPSIAETLAGRTDIVPLWPLSMGEVTQGDDDFVDRAFSDPERLLDHEGRPRSRSEYFDLLCAGGYPEVQDLSGRLRQRWFARYVQTVIQREIEVAADIRRADALRDLVRFFAATTAQELVLSKAAERLGLDRSTVSTYEPWLETVFLVHRIPAWSRNLTAKVIKRPKIYLSDTGIAAALLGKDSTALQQPTDPAAGPLFETFVANELSKQLTWSDVSARLFHFRDASGSEVDLVLESDDGRVVGIEVKATSTPRGDDFRGLRLLRDRLAQTGTEFVAGVVLHTGERRLPFGDRLFALPAADLWT